MCQYSAPPGYQCKSEPVSRKLVGFTDIIDSILEADKQVHAKQCQTLLGNLRLAAEAIFKKI
jgi:hypothetical protein